MDFSNIFSSLKRQFVSSNKPNVTDSKENVTHLGSGDISSNIKPTNCEMDESYLLVNANLDVEVMVQNEPDLLPNDGLLLPGPVSDSPSLQDSNSAFFNHKNAISDVPFHLHDSLVTQQQINSLFTDTNLTYQSFDWMKYSVDFHNEQAVLSGYSRKQE